MPYLNQSILIEIYAELLRQSHEHVQFERTQRLMLSGKLPFNAFLIFIKSTRSITTVPDSPPRVDIAIGDEKTCLSILNRHGSFGQKIIEAAIEYTPKLVCERIPVWVRPAIKYSLLSNRINELEVFTLENTAVTYLRALCKSVKRLIDHTGNLVETIKSGSFDFVYMEKKNLSWTKQFFSNMRFESKVLKIQITENDYGFLQIESGFKNSTWKKNPRLNSIQNLNLVFNLHKSNKPVIQNLINTFTETFPNVKSLIFEVTYNFITSPEMEKQIQNIPKKLHKTIEAFENAKVPENLQTVKLFIETHCTEIINSRHVECPPRLKKSLISYELIIDDKRVCQWQRNFKFGEKKTARLLLNLYFKKSRFAI